MVLVAAEHHELLDCKHGQHSDDGDDYQNDDVDPLSAVAEVKIWLMMLCCCCCCC